MSVYGRLGYNFNTTQFNGADVLSPNVINYLNNSNIQLSPWQVNDLSNSTVGGYYQNPHANSLATLSVYLGAMFTAANNANLSYTYVTDQGNTLVGLLNSVAPSLISFTTHTNNLAGVTRSSNTTLYPDLSSALAVGRQILNITNQINYIMIRRFL